MSDNPFEALGGDGGFDMSALLQQAQQMQEQLQVAQERLAETVVEGTAGSVTVKLSGVGDLLGVEVKPGSFDGDSAEDLADLGDLVVAAFRDAKGKADALAAETFGPMTGGSLPGMPAPGQLGF